LAFGIAPPTAFGSYQFSVISFQLTKKKQAKPKHNIIEKII